jgi:membrane dipeptidase
VSKYPDLFAELLLRGWTEGELEKLAGLNVLRVLRQAEQVCTDYLFLHFVIFKNLAIF